MTKNYFSAYALTEEFNLNKIAKHYNISRKYKWEDCLILGSDQLGDMLSSGNTKMAHIYSFGCIVFINFSAAEMTSFIKLLENDFNESSLPFSMQYLDEYELEVSTEAKIKITNDSAVCPDENNNYTDIISLILARSSALDKIEHSVDIVLDEVEEILNRLEYGKLDIKDKKLAKLASKILGIKFASISYIMLLDKPEIAWEDTKIDDFYHELSEFFEIGDRYAQLREKLEFLMDITEVFSSLAHENRATRLEWYVIIIIAVELLVYLADLATKIFMHI